MAQGCSTGTCLERVLHYRVNCKNAIDIQSHNSSFHPRFRRPEGRQTFTWSARHYKYEALDTAKQYRDPSVDRCSLLITFFFLSFLWKGSQSEQLIYIQRLLQIYTQTDYEQLASMVDTELKTSGIVFSFGKPFSLRFRWRGFLPRRQVLSRPSPHRVILPPALLCPPDSIPPHKVMLLPPILLLLSSTSPRWLLCFKNFKIYFF